MTRAHATQSEVSDASDACQAGTETQATKAQQVQQAPQTKRRKRGNLAVTPQKLELQAEIQLSTPCRMKREGRLHYSPRLKRIK